MQETRVQSLGQEDLLEVERQPTLVFLPGESHGQTSLTGYSPWGCKELDATECTHTHSHKYNFLVFTQGNFEKFIYISFSWL